MLIPENWPSNVKYKNTVDRKKAVLSFGCLEGVQTIKIKDDNHILKGQYGVFATRDWGKYEIIGCYCGEIKSNNGGKYVANLYTSRSGNEWTIDSEKEGNETRFINDYRNISKEKNVSFEKTIINNQRMILIVVIKNISEGEEILSDYGDDYWKYIKLDD